MDHHNKSSPRSYFFVIYSEDYICMSFLKLRWRIFYLREGTTNLLKELSTA